MIKRVALLTFCLALIVAAGAQRRAHLVRPPTITHARIMQPGDLWEYSVSMAAGKEQVGASIQGTWVMQALPDRVRSPQGIACLQVQETMSLHSDKGEMKQSETQLISQDAMGRRRTHGSLVKGKPKWIQNKAGFVVDGIGPLRKGERADSGSYDDEQGQKTRETSKLEAMETIATAGGKMGCYRLRITLEHHGKESDVANGFSYISPELGMVRLSISGDRGGTGGMVHYQMNGELQKAKLNGGHLLWPEKRGGK